MNAAYLRTKSESEVVPITWIVDRPVSTATVNVTVEIGDDPNPEGILGFGPLIDGNTVVQYAQQGIAGNTYKINILATMIDSTTLCTVAYLPVGVCGQ